MSVYKLMRHGVYSVYSEGREWLTYTGKSGKRRYVSAEDTIRFGYM